MEFKKPRKSDSLDRSIPLEVAELCPEARTLYQLADLDRKLEATIQDKRRAILDLHKQMASLEVPTHTAALTISAQISAAPPKSNAESNALSTESNAEALVTISMVGRVSPAHHFTAFFDRMEATLHPPQGVTLEDPSPAVWERTPTYSDTQGWKFAKKVRFEPSTARSHSLALTIRLRPSLTSLSDDTAPKFVLPVGVRAGLGLHGHQRHSRTEIFKAVYAYAAANELIGADGRIRINTSSDTVLSPLLSSQTQKEALTLSELTHALGRAIHDTCAPQPSIIQCSFKLDGSTQPQDVSVALEGCPHTAASASIGALADEPLQREIAECDRQISDAFAALRRSAQRYKLLSSFCSAPLHTADRSVTARANGLKRRRDELIEESAVRQGGEFYSLPAVQEAVLRYTQSIKSSQK